MKVARPRRSAQSRSQVARSRLVSSRGRPFPPASEQISAVVTFGRLADTMFGRTIEALRPQATDYAGQPGQALQAGGRAFESR
jgi:hypothetical protein